MSNSTSLPDTLQVDVEHRGKVAVIRLAGSANMVVSDSLEARLVEVVDAAAEQLILDLSDLQFISSVGLGALVAAHLRCRHHKSVVKLVGPQPKIRELLEVTRLTKLFSIHDSVEAALAAD